MESKKTSKVNVKAIIGILVFSGLIATFNETILNVALSALMVEMNVTAGTIQWIITAYMIVVAVLVPVTAFLMQTFETKKIFMTAMGILLVGTIAAACSGTFIMLLLSRIIQAAGTGMIIPIMMNTALAVSPPKSRGIVMGLCGCSLTLGPALGPTVAGILLQSCKWNLLFIILIPVVILSMILGSIYLVNVSVITKPKLDFISIILSTIGFGALIYGISSISSKVAIGLILISFIVGIFALILFCIRQLHLDEPMLNIRVFKYPVFSIGTLLVMFSMMTIFTLAVMLPMYFENALGASTFTAAMALLPATLISAILTPVAGKIYDKKGGKFLLPIGFIVMLIPLLIMANLAKGATLTIIITLFIILDIGVALVMSPSQTTALSLLPHESYPHGVAILNTLQQFSSAIGSSLFIGIMSASQIKALNNAETESNAAAIGFGSAVMVLAIFVVVAVVLAIYLSFINKKSVELFKSDFSSESLCRTET